jgi:negative regulator of sigma E activity
MREPFANEQLTAYLDGELDPAERAAVESALAADPALREELEALRRVSGLLRRHGPVDAPPDFVRGVLERARQEPAPRTSWWAWLRRPFGMPLEGLAVAAVAALVVVIALVGRPTAEPEADRFAAPAAPDLAQPDVAQRDMTRPDVAQRDVAAAEGQAPSPSGAPAADRLSSAAPSAAVGLRDEDDGLDAVADVWNASEAAGGSSSGEAESIKVIRGTSTAAGGGATPPAADGLAEDETVSASPPVAAAPPPVARPAATGSAGLYGVSYRYRVSTSDPDAVARLLRLAAQHQGRVLDDQGVAVQDARGRGEHSSYRVLLPADALAAFGRSLRTLGGVEEVPDERMFAASTVAVQVDLVLTSASEPSRRALYEDDLAEPAAAPPAP